MSGDIRVVRGDCSRHGSFLVRAVSGIRSLCPRCDKPQKPLSNVTPYTARAWEEARATAELEACDAALGRAWSPRRHRLAFCALARMYFTQSRQYWLWKAVEAGELWADMGSPPVEANDIFLRLGGQTRDEWKPGEWTWLAVQCVSGAHEEERDDRNWDVSPYTYHFPDPVFSLTDGMEKSLQPAPAIVYRELVPNPFIPLTLKPDWLTETVRDLALHIYAANDFSAMPILADALQDAGCDDEQVLTHCRANKPHARGCWVLDAILGKA